MTWFRVGGAGIPAALKNAMNAVFNKKFGTSGQNYPPNQWPDEVNLMGPLPEGTASGSIAHTDDAADTVPIKNWIVTLPASLDGYTAVNGTKAGKNLISTSDFEQGSINSSGADLDSIIRLRSNYILVNAGADYSFSVSGTDIQIYFVFQYNASGVFISRDSVDNTSGSITLRANTKYFRILVRKTNNATIVPSDLIIIQLEQSATPTTYEAKSATTQTVELGRTIYGGTADLVTGEGEDENGNTFTFTPITPTPDTALGVNNFWSDNGDSEVVYRRDIDLALQAVSSSRGLMMASRPVTQLVGEESDPDQVNELVENDETEQEGENDAR